MASARSESLGADFAMLCELLFQRGTMSFNECLRILNDIAARGYAVVAPGIQYYVANKLKAAGFIRWTRVLKCGTTEQRVVYVANRSKLARLRLLIESLDVPPPPCL